eukprot:gene32046-38750_t
MDLLQPVSVPLVPHERALRLIKKVKTPKIEIKLTNPACQFEDEIDDAPLAIPEVAHSPPLVDEKPVDAPPAATKPAKRPKLPPPSNYKKSDRSHRKVVDPAEVKKPRQHTSPSKKGVPREFVNIAKPVHILPPSSSSKSQSASVSDNNNLHVASSDGNVSAPSVIISELPMRTFSLSNDVSPASSNKKALPSKKSGFVNQFLALKDKSEFINQNYSNNNSGAKSKIGTASPPSPSSPRSPNHGLPAIDVSNLQKLDALTFGVKVEDYPALNRAIHAVSPKRPPALTNKLDESIMGIVMDDSGMVSSARSSDHHEDAISGVVSNNSINNVIYIPSPVRRVVESDSVFNTGLNSPAVLEPPVLDMDNDFNMSPVLVTGETVDVEDFVEREYQGEAEEKGTDQHDQHEEAEKINRELVNDHGHDSEDGEASKDGKQNDEEKEEASESGGDEGDMGEAASENDSEVAEEIDEAIEDGLDASDS